MKKLVYLLFISLTMNSFSQKQTCDTEKSPVIDLNSITKCTVEQSKKSGNKKTRQISVKISASKTRFLKRRKKQVVSNANELNGAGISTIKHSSNISNSLKFKTNLKALTNRLTKEEVRSAQKFSSVDNIPVFTNCTNEKGGDQLDCFNNEMMKHIQEYFIYPDKALIDKIEGKVWVRFIIDKNGDVTNIKALGPKGGKILNDEAIRVVSNLPKFEPAYKNGERISVKYGFPINFSLDGE